MNVAKSVLGVLFALPVAELIVFIVAASLLGFAGALALVVASSILGVVVLRRAGGAHIERVRTAVGSGNFTAITADGSGAMTLLAGFLLVIPGLITSAVGLFLLVTPLRRLIGWLLGIKPAAPAARTDGVVDLEREQWRRVPDPALSDKRDEPPR